MRLIGILMTACVILAAAQAVAVALAILLGLALIYSLFTAPKETLGVIALLLVAGMWQAYPLALLGLVGLLVVLKLLTNHRG
ncbi:MAG: hypothetical protein DI533_22430 [Cereibacter sphaeroides]|uniref:Uncharacterized protein n=1 Tax=Cereibacter sphaeroides TaxID=1063 RepID=A0A2W5RV74_CERSP|nr:MAG: hypothetical protein DI533_22430 [Cereibacter sphaeroides]